jgi:uncharacterized membrane protein
MWVQKKRLLADVHRWRNSGWVTAEGEGQILAELARGSGPGLAGALSILAAVLLGFAAMSFVAANWQDMSRLARLALLFAGLAASYGAAGVFFQRGMSAFGHSSILAGVTLFGASIMLISQMFHTDGNPADAVLVWAIGGLLAGVVLRSNPTLAFSMILMTLWWIMEAFERDTVFWPYLLGWGAVAAAMYWQKWRPGIHVAGLPLAAFIIMIGYVLPGSGADILAKRDAHWFVTLAGLGLAGLAIWSERAQPQLSRLWSGMLGYATAIAFAGLWALQFSDGWYSANGAEESFARLLLLALITLALLVAAIWWGLTSGHRGVLWLGYLGFSIEILSIYAKKFGTLLDTSLVFLGAGLIVAGLAYMAYRLHGEAKEHAL